MRIVSVIFLASFFLSSGQASADVNNGPQPLSIPAASSSGSRAATLGTQAYANGPIQWTGTGSYVTHWGSQSSVELTYPTISNTSSTYTSGTLELVLWASQNPYNGGSINGYQLATYQFSQVLRPNQYYPGSTVQVPLASPPDGAWYLTLTVEEYQSSGNYAIDTWISFPQPLVGSTGSAPPNGRYIYLDGTVAYQTHPDPGGSTITLTADKVVNDSYRSSGTLKIELWAANAPYSSGTLTGYTLGSSQTNPSTLAPSFYLSGVSATVPYTPPPNGTYQVIMTLEEYQNGGFVIVDWINFDKPVIFGPGGGTVTCSYALSAASAGFTAAAGSGSVNMIAPNGCAWTATSNVPWLTITAGASGTGNGTTSFHLDANSGSSARTGTLTIGGQTVTVTQAGAAITPPTALRFVPVRPCRVADTRAANGLGGGPLLSAQTTRDFPIPQSGCDIPASAQAYSLNFTVVPSGKLTFLTVFPTGQPQPVASTLNSYDGRTKANAAIVPAGVNGAVSVFATDDTQLIIDINGYFVPASTSTALAFYPMTPCRLVDTRGAVTPLGAPSLVAQQERVLPILASTCDVPNTAQAYSLNYTVIPKGPLTYLTTWPSGQGQPGVSTLNAPTGTIAANAAIVPAGSVGDLSVYASDNTDLIIVLLREVLAYWS